MSEEGLDFRATKDIDLVLIIEAVDVNFGKKFWEYVKQAGYEHCNKSSGVSQFYRFTHPSSNQFPAMIELFSRKSDAIQLPESAVLTPLPIDEDISSLSAILLDGDYYDFLKQGNKLRFFSYKKKSFPFCHIIRKNRRRLTIKKIPVKKYNAIVKAKEAVRDFDLNNRDLETIEGAVELTRRLALQENKGYSIKKSLS